MTKDVVLFDLDSTLADVQHRESWAQPGNPDHSKWIAYSRACVGDTPIQGPVRALQTFKRAGLFIALVSGRNSEAREETVEWLKAHDIDYDFLRLRSADDIQHNGDYKVAYIEKLRGWGYNPILMFEDHVGVAQMVEAAGVPCVNVRPPYEDNVGSNFNRLRDGEK